MDWFISLSEDEQAFVKQIILQSGSLKSLAKFYNVSYPTVRIRLNRLIEKINLIEREQRDNFETHIMQKVIDGKIELETAKELIDFYRRNNK